MLYRHQRGEIGFQTFLLIVAAVFFIKAAYSLIPIYLERNNAVSMLEEAIEEARLGDHSKRQFLENIAGKYSFNGISNPSVGSYELRREGRVVFIETDYSVSVPYMYGVDLVVNFEPISIDVTDIVSTQ